MPSRPGKSAKYGRKKAAPKSGFLYHFELRLVRSGAGSGGSSVSSSGSSARSGVSNSGSGASNGGSGVSGSGSSFGSGRSGSVSGLFSLLTASGQSHGSDQRSQQERLFHACVLKRSVNKTGGLGTMCKAHSPIEIRDKGKGCIATGVAPHSACDYTLHQAIPYRPRVVGGKASCERCKFTSISLSHVRKTPSSRVQTPAP